MAVDADKLDVLDGSDAALLADVLCACEASQSFIDVRPFRRDHYAQIGAIDRLEKYGYLIKERVVEKKLYKVSLMAIVQLQHCQVAQNIMATAEALWAAFRKHYETSLDQPVALNVIADLIDVSVEHVTRVHAYMREWWHTPSCFTVADLMYQAVTVREDVLGSPDFATCVQNLREMQARQIHSPSNGFAALGDQVDESIKPSAPTVSRSRAPSWLGKLPPHAQLLIREIDMAMAADLLALPAMGVRAVIDVVSDDLLGVTLQNFGEKLNALRTGGYLEPRQFDVLQAVVEVGHAAAHRAHSPDQAAVQLMVDSLEHMLFSAYELDGASRTLIANTPPRQARTKVTK